MTNIKIYTTKDFLRMSEAGEVSMEKSLSLLEGLVKAAAEFPDHDMVIDIRDTVGALGPSELLAVAVEVSKHKNLAKHRLAFLIPNVEIRLFNARFFETAMELRGFQVKGFINFEDAMNWLCEITEIKPIEEKVSQPPKLS